MMNLHILIVQTLLIFITTFTVIDAAASCTTLSNSAASKLNNSCAAVVDYSFYLPNGVSLYYLEQTANALLGGVSLKVLPTACQEALRNQVCAGVYMKCQPGLVFTDPATYNYAIYSDFNINVALPFQRPCLSVCNKIATVCTGIYQTSNSFPNCAQTKDYSGGAVSSLPFMYDQNVTSNKCFSPRTDQRIAASTEVYQYANTSGVCAGLIDTMYIPPGNKVQPYFAVLQEPYAMQAQIEMQLVQKTKAFPAWLNNKCHLAMLRYLCGTVYPRSQVKTMRTVILESPAPLPGLVNTIGTVYPTLLNTPVELPSFPREDICLDFQETCAPFIFQANSSALTPNCSSLATGTTYRKYPRKDQVVASSSVASLGGASMYFYTSPNNMSLHTDAYNYQSTCPEGFVHPQHPNNTRIQWVKGTGCAVSCRLKEWTDSEWTMFEKQSVVIPIAGAVLSALLMVTFLSKTKDLRDNYLVMLFTALSFVASVASAVLNNRPFDDRFCYDNAVNDNSTDSPGSLCVIQAVILVYVLLASVAINFMMILDVFFKIHAFHDLIDHAGYVAGQLVFILLLPIIPVAYAANKKLYGFSKSQPFCFIMQTPFAPENVDMALVALPVTIVTIMTLIVFIAVLCSWCCCNKRNNQIVDEASVDPNGFKVVAKTSHRHSRANIMYHTVPATLFTFVMFTVWFGYIISRAVFYVVHAQYSDSFLDWALCIFKNYYGDSAYSQSVCGAVPETRPATGLVSWLIVCLTGKSIIVAGVYLVVWVVRLIWPVPLEVINEDEDSLAQMQSKDKQSVAVVVQNVQPVMAIEVRSDEKDKGGGGGAGGDLEMQEM